MEQRDAGRPPCCRLLESIPGTDELTDILHSANNDHRLPAFSEDARKESGDVINVFLEDGFHRSNGVGRR